MRRFIVLGIVLFGLIAGSVALAQEGTIDTVHTSYGFIDIEYGSHPFDGDFCGVDAVFDGRKTVFSITYHSEGPYFSFAKVTGSPAFVLFHQEVTTLMYVNELVREVSGIGTSEITGLTLYDWFGTFDTFVSQAQTDVLIRFQGGLGTNEFTIPLFVIEDALEHFNRQCGSLFPSE